jgi:hypothetical protein
MFFFASANALSSSVSATSTFDARAFAIKMSWRISSSSRLSFAASVSSSDSTCDAFPVR